MKALVDQIYECFRKGDFSKAIQLSEEGHINHLEDEELLYLLKASLYWSEKISKSQEINNLYERAEFILKEWKNFCYKYISRFKVCFERGKVTIQQYLYSHLERIYQSLIYDSGQIDSELLLKIGKCYKGMGNYEQAIEVFSEALRIDREDPDIMAQLADSHALIDEEVTSKVLFREAFLLGAQKIDIESLESGIIHRLIETLKEEKTLSDTLLKEWIPVYGTLLGIFDIKRELRPLELGKLKQSIYQLKEEVKQTTQKRIGDSVFIPRLINRYFWLIDHYIRVQEDRSRVEEMLNSIKELDSAIYQKYIQ